MKLVIVEPPDVEKAQFEITGKFEDIFSAGLYLEGIYVGKEYDDFIIDWNNVYKYYELKMLCFPNNGINVRRSHWDDVEQWLRRNNYRYERGDGSYWKWVNGVYIEGTRFFIYPQK
jgi:hypothetical protein